MARRKKTAKRAKPQYVRAKKRKGAESSALARRSLSIVLLLVVLGVVVFGVVKGFKWIDRKLFSENPRFEIQHLVVSCDGKLTEERIREYTGLAEGMNLFEVSFGEIEGNLLDVSRIESVHLERKLPHTLIVKVKERVPVAQIVGLKVSRYPFLVDRYGYVLPYRHSAATLPLIKGLDKELRPGMPTGHPDVRTALQIIALCDSVGYLRTYVQIESLDLEYSDYIYMRLKGNVYVKMPRFSLKPKLQNLATTIKIEGGKGTRVKEVDLTLDSAKVPVLYY